MTQHVRKYLLGIAVAVLAAALLPASPATAASLVPVTITVLDTAGNPVPHFSFYLTSSAGGTTYTEWSATGASGTVTVPAVPSATARLWPVEYVAVNADGSRVVALGASVITDSSGGGQSMQFTAATGTTGTTMSLQVPALETRTYRVLTESGLPVAGVQVSTLASVSVPVTDPATGTVYRWLDDQQSGARTDADGYTTITSYALEPDPAVVKQFKPGYADMDLDGVVDGLVVYFNPTMSSQLSSFIPYSQWGQTLTPVITLPYVPEVATAVAAPGAYVGDTSVSATLVQPTLGAAASVQTARSATSAGFTLTNVPLANTVATLWAQVRPGAVRTRLASAKSDSLGRVRFGYDSHATTRMIVTVSDGTRSHVARVIVAKPRTGLGFARIQYNAAGTDRTTRTSLNGEYFQIHNYTTAARALTGWTVRTRAGAVYKFPRITLAAGATVWVHTGPGTTRAGHLFWNRRAHTWSNTSDVAILRNAAGTAVDRCAWTTAGAGLKVC